MIRGFDEDATVMVEEFDLARQARFIPKEERSRFLTECLETELHSYLATLFCRVEETASAEITHGPDEFGRDIVLRRSDPYGEQYIGVVVKRNPYRNFSGRTAGPIDEMISQAKQATVYPCQLKDISAEKVIISGVWIALFGRMTNNAMIRLRSETADVPGIRILALENLVDLFTDYYPEVFFEGGVSEYLADKIIELEKWRGISNRHLKLSESFVDPMVAEADAEISLMDEGLSFVFGNKRLPFARLEEHINPDSKLLLTGDPGTGKSTALRKIAIDRLTEAHNATLGFTSASKRRETSQQIPIPVLINAVQTRNGTTVSELIAAELPPRNVSDRFCVSLILLDGLDEVPREMWRGILNEVFAITQEYGCGLLISSRKVPSLHFNVVDQANSPVKVFDILPFEFGQALEVINKVTNDSDVISILQDGLARLSHQIIFTPIALELLIEIAEAEREIPGSISEIFERYTDIALGRYDSQKGIQVVFDYFAKKRFLSELAWSEFKSKDRLELPRTEFEEFLSNYVDRFGWSAESFNALIEEVERSGILRFNDAVFFSHRSFLDFFVALWVVEHRHEASDYEQQLADLYFDWVWSEVAIYAVGQARQANSRLLEKVFESQSDGEAVEYHMMKFMIGRLLQAGWHSTSDVKRDGIRMGVSHGEEVFNHFRQSRDADPERIPSVFPLFFLLAFGELAYSSRTLLKEAIAILKDLPIDKSESEFFQRMSLTWAVRNRIESDHASSLVQTAVEHLAVLEKNNVLSLEERFSSLLFLTQLGEDDKLLVKPLKRKAQRLARKYPSLKNAIPWLSGGQITKR